MKRKLLELRLLFIAYFLTHFKIFWSIILKIPIIKTYVTRFLYHIITLGFRYPLLYSTKYPYPTVIALDDYSFYSRILPEKQRPPGYQYPPADEVARDIFLRKEKSNMNSKRTDRNSNLFFGGWAQWFSANFLLTDSQNSNRSAFYPTGTLDLSTVYGNDEKTTLMLRTLKDGKLKSQFINGQEYPLYMKDIPGLEQTPLFQNYLQRPGTRSILQNAHRSVDIDSLFAFGQMQINSTPLTVIWGTIFLREHNQICDELKKRYTEWDDERLFQTARNIAVIILNKIIVRDYISKHNGKHLAMDIPFAPEALKDSKWNFGGVRNAPIEWNHLYRFHSFVPDTFLFDGEECPLATGFYNPEFVIQHGLDKLIDQVSKSPICHFGSQNTPHFLLHIEKQTIEEGRYANLAPYNDYREAVGMPRVLRFEDINPNPSIVNALRKHYKSVDDIEYYVGLIAEAVPANRLFPPLLQRILSSFALYVVMSQPWLESRIWSRREELLTSFGCERLNNTTIESLVYRHVSKETYVSFFLPERRI